MVTAMAYPEGRQGKRNDLLTSFLKKEVEDNPPSAGHISKARYVLRNNFTPEGQQYPDRCLAVMAERIQAREIRRCGELLKQVETGQGVRTDLLHDATDMKLSRSQAARDAGISERQKVTALLVAMQSDYPLTILDISM